MQKNGNITAGEPTDEVKGRIPEANSKNENHQGLHTKDISEVDRQEGQMENGETGGSGTFKNNDD